MHDAQLLHDACKRIENVSARLNKERADIAGKAGTVDSGLVYAVPGARRGDFVEDQNVHAVASSIRKDVHAAGDRVLWDLNPGLKRRSESRRRRIICQKDIELILIDD